MTKEQRKAHSKFIEQACLAALRTQFTGEGAAARRWRFFWRGMLDSAGWTAKFLCLGSWAVISGLLVGPDHDVFFKEVYAWMVATPFDQVLAETHAQFLSGTFMCAKFGLIVGFALRLFQIAKSAADAANEQLFRHDPEWPQRSLTGRMTTESYQTSIRGDCK